MKEQISNGIHEYEPQPPKAEQWSVAPEDFPETPAPSIELNSETLSEVETRGIDTQEVFETESPEVNEEAAAEIAKLRAEIDQLEASKVNPEDPSTWSDGLHQLVGAHHGSVGALLEEVGPSLQDKNVRKHVDGYSATAWDKTMPGLIQETIKSNNAIDTQISALQEKIDHLG